MSILPCQMLRRMVLGLNPMILADDRINEKQIQPSSIDCRLGNVAYRMRTAAIPKKGEKISDLIKAHSLYAFELNQKSILERGGCYIIPLKERLYLPDEFCAVFSPKSSIGRVDVFVRVLADDVPRYDRTRYGYAGPLYLEIVPLSFSVNVAPDLEMVQMRIRRRDSGIYINTECILAMHSDRGLVYDNDGIIKKALIENSALYLGVDLKREIIGFEARENLSKELDLGKKYFYGADDFWIPIKGPREELILTPDHFYLLSTKERVRTPPECAVEVAAYSENTGEFRSHYAGFFDPGFGGDSGTSAVLEIRPRDVHFRITDGQQICKMVFEEMTEIPDTLYGKTGSHYVGEGPSLSKHFLKNQW